MKILTMLTAVAALVAGISVASAQTSSSPAQSAPPKASGSGNAAFCINNCGKSARLNCKYQTMASCEKDAKPQNLNCSANPNKSTTGSKM